MNRWAGQPLPISATCWHDGDADGAAVGRARGGGRGARDSSAASASATAEAGALLGRHARADAIRSSPATTPLWRLSLPSTTPPLALPGEQLIEWGGALRWLRGERRRARRCARRRRAPAATRRCSAAATSSRPACSSRSPPALDAHPPRPQARLRSARHPQSRPAVPGFLDGRPISPTSSATRPPAARPTRSCASACTAASAPRPARPTSCSATSSTARAAAST